MIDAVTPDVVAAKQNAHNAQKQAAKTEQGSGSEQNGVDVCFFLFVVCNAICDLNTLLLISGTIM